MTSNIRKRKIEELDLVYSAAGDFLRSVEKTNEIKDIGKQKAEKIYETMKKTIFSTNFTKSRKKIIQVFLAFIIPILIFFPIQIREIILPIAIILITITAILFFLKILFLEEIVVGCILIIFLLSLTFFINCGSQECFWVISTRFGTLVALLAFLLTLIVFITVALLTTPFKFALISCIITILIMLIIIPIISPKSYYSFCKKIPFIYGTFLCRSKEIRIDPIKTVKIPVSGGISVNIETPETMYAGEPYEFTYTVKNNYESDIYFDVQVGMLSSYGSGVVFSHPYKVRKSTLSSKAYYQDTVYIDPEKLTVVEDTCPYNTLYLGLAKGMNKITEMEEKIECSKEKKCKDPKSACVKIDFFECKCVDWVELTCSKNDIKVKMTVEHDGVFIGNGSLYYSETITSPARSTELVQGPLSVIIEFLPNPYIASIHQYIEDVSVYVTLKNQGGTIKIKDFKLEPIDTVIHTINKENGVELIEEIGVDVISCRDITEIVPEGIMSYGSEVGGKICSVTPPFVKTTIKDLEKNTIVELNNVTFSGLKYFCEKETPNYLNQNESKLNWSKYWDKIYELVGESGLCEILKKKEGDNDKIIVSNALKHVDVELTITYERTGDYYSKNIVPYTRTEKCIERLNQ